MSKKQIRSRLDRLFSNLAANGEATAESEPISGSEVAPEPASAAASEAKAKIAAAAAAASAAGAKPNSGCSLEQGHLSDATQVWTEAGAQSLDHNVVMLTDGSSRNPAAIAVPLHTQSAGSMLLEIVDDSNEREWSDDDRFLVLEVAAQLALALENAQLYQSVQQELADRIRAEQTTLRRNQDLAALNQIGQQLSRLATQEEIYTLLADMIGQMLDNRNLFICIYNTNQQTLSYPIYHVDGQPITIPDRPLVNGIPEYVITHHKPLLVKENTARFLAQHGIDLPSRVPASLLAIPMDTGERTVGVLVVQNFEQENAYDSIHMELLSTAAAQVTTALENAVLFQQMQEALEAIENRERYQANVARSAAVLTEYGTKSLPEVMKVLGQAAQCSRVYYARLIDDERGLYWSAANEWVDPSVNYLFDKTRIQHIPVNVHENWARELREKGWTITQASDDASPETEFLNHQHIRSSLLLAVPGASTMPNYIAFDQLSAQQVWQAEDINALRVAADAISNTFVREGLLEQLQLTLDETEGLYKASNRLTLANDMQEMVTAILSGTRSADINRAVLILFEYDTYGKISLIVVGASWYSGRGTPPPPVGTEYLRAKYERILQTAGPVFYEDILDAQMDKELQETLLHQNIRALAILPLWSGKRQTGALLLQSEVKHPFTGRETRTYPPLVDQMAIAVENQRLFEQTQKSLAETELLYNVSNRIAQASEAQDLLALVVETVLPAGADRASLFMIESDPSGELIDLEVVGFHEARGDYQWMGMHLPVSALPLVKSLADEPVIISDINQMGLDSATRKTLEQFKIISACIVPLRTGGRLIGLLNASSRYPTEFSAEDTHLMRIVGNGIAVALEKQRLLRQAQRRALELQTASEIARDTASTLSLDLLLNRIVYMLSERFGFYFASILLLDETGTYAVVREATGEVGEEMKQRGHRLTVGSRSVIGTVTATGEPFIINDVHQNRTYYANPLLPETRSEMGVPLKLGPTVIGVIDLHSRDINAFNQDDVTVLQILADQIAIAIENARAYELSQKAIADMREIDRVKSQFLANMSHELRTPLNSIIGFSRVILKGIDGPVNEVQKQDLTAIYNSGQHLLSLINDVLDLSKIEAGKMELAFSDVNLIDLINSAMSTAVGLVKDKPIKLKTIVPDSLPMVKADSTRLRQVLINFLSNAAKFTEEGSITVEAALRRGENGKPFIFIMVEDSGPGIAEADQHKLFLPFSQVDDSPTRKTGGTGLGLSICRSLIEMHGGRIGLLQSTVGKGSTFYFSLPVIAPDEPDPEEETFKKSRTVLAVDDDSNVINLYERYLKPHGYYVIPLTDSKKVVDQAKEVRPFAITLDIMMPDRDGWQVMCDLKNDPATRDIPIVICSILENQEKGFSMGAADYLVKPFLPDDMLNAIHRINRDGLIQEILVIDDSQDDLRLVKKMLEENNLFRVSLALGGNEGWEAVNASRPDAIILDLFMPDLNGFEILERLRIDPDLRHIPVIVLTGADLTPEQHQQLTEFGQGVIGKGYLREKELLVVLEETLRKYTQLK
jgi:signal transduction histidine kinase/CheY-like chemotaxis protein